MNEIIYQKSYREYKAELDGVLQRTSEGFVQIGYLLKLARDTDILKESGYANVNDFAKAEYGIDKTMVSRFININDRFSEGGNSSSLRQQYQGFGYAKLSIMLQLPDAINEELTPAYSKTEIQAIKEEYDEEMKKTDLEVLMEEKPEGQQDKDNLVKAIIQLGMNEQRLYLDIYDAVYIGKKEALQETFAPAGESIYSIRLPGIGKMILSVKGLDRDIMLTNIRTNEKESYSWEDLQKAAELIVDLTLGPEESWEKIYGEVFPKEEKEQIAEVAPVQQQKEIQNQPPKKKSKVIKSKEVVKKPEKTESEADTKLEEELMEEQKGQQLPENGKSVTEMKIQKYLSKVYENIETTKAYMQKRKYGLARLTAQETVETLNDLIDWEKENKEDGEDGR